jgi:hypothetical protein
MQTLVSIKKGYVRQNRQNIRETMRTDIQSRIVGDNNRYRCWRDSGRIMRQPASARLSELQTLKLCRATLADKLARAFAGHNTSDFIRLVNDNGHLINENANLLENAERFIHEDLCWCEDCGDLTTWDDTINAYDEHRICSHCDGNYYYHEGAGFHVRDDDDDYRDYEDEDEDSYSGSIGDYHSSRRQLGHISSSFDTRKPRVLLGLELEMEIGKDHNPTEVAEHILDNIGYVSGGTKYCLMEYDGSLSRGFEMVTGYSGLDLHTKQLEFFKSRLAGAKSHNTSTCGLHVHICKSDMSLLHASKMVLFINDIDNHKLIFSLARRDSSSFCKIHDKANDKYWLKDALKSGEGYQPNEKKARQLRNLNSDRYEALNFQNPNTVEFRLFRGTLKYETLIACLEFTYQTWFFCRDTSQKQLTTQNFLKYICLENNRKDTKFLRAYLAGKGFVLPFQNKQTTSNLTSEEI